MMPYEITVAGLCETREEAEKIRVEMEVAILKNNGEFDFSLIEEIP